jgi:hypothetical protein
MKKMDELIEELRAQLEETSLVRWIVEVNSEMGASINAGEHQALLTDVSFTDGAIEVRLSI